jgi:hypothetical protein
LIGEREVFVGIPPLAGWLSALNLGQGQALSLHKTSFKTFLSLALLEFFRNLIDKPYLHVLYVIKIGLWDEQIP